MKISELQQTHTSILSKLDELHEIQNQTHSQYKEYAEKNKTNKVFGLDSFNYQTRLFDLEIKHVKEQYSFVNNRIYCDYYKLYGMVKFFYKENFKLEPKKRNYLPYKDLEPYKPYEFLDSMNLNQDILDMIQKSFEIIRKKEDEVSASHTSQRLNLDNYIYNHRYNNDSLKTKVELYEKYLESYHIYHMSFLSNLLEKVGLVFRQNTQTVSLGQLDLQEPTNPIQKNTPSIEPHSIEHVVINIQDGFNLVDPVSMITSTNQVEVPKVEPVEPKEEPKEEPVEPKEEPKEETKEEPKEEPKEETKEEPVDPKEEPVDPKEEPKEENKEEPKEENKEEPVKANQEPVELKVKPDEESKGETKEEIIEIPAVPVAVPAEVPAVPAEVPAVPAEVHDKLKKKSKKSKK